MSGEYEGRLAELFGKTGIQNYLLYVHVEWDVKPRPTHSLIPSWPNRKVAISLPQRNTLQTRYAMTRRPYFLKFLFIVHCTLCICTLTYRS